MTAKHFMIDPMGKQLVAVVALVSAIVLHAQPITARDSAEAAVWRLVTSASPAALLTAVPWHHPFMCLGASRRSGCAAESLPPEFHPAMRDFQSRGRNTTALSPAVFALVGAAVRQDSSAVADRCRFPSQLSISRVGLDSTLSYGVVEYAISVGARPFPSCGFAFGNTLLVHRRPDGSWETVRMIAGWIT